MSEYVSRKGPAKYWIVLQTGQNHIGAFYGSARTYEEAIKKAKREADMEDLDLTILKEMGDAFSR